MANHSFVRIQDPQTVDAAEDLLKSVVLKLLGDRLQVERRPQTKGLTGSWFVFLPGSELSEDVALNYNKAPDDAYGFEVALDPTGLVFEFRHPHNSWENWAQDRIQHTLARRFDTYIDDEGVGRITANPEELRDTFSAYIRRNFTDEQMLEESTRKWLDYLRSQAPVGFRD